MFRRFASVTSPMISALPAQLSSIRRVGSDSQPIEDEAAKGRLANGWHDATRATANPELVKTKNEDTKHEDVKEDKKKEASADKKNWDSAKDVASS